MNDKEQQNFIGQMMAAMSKQDKERKAERFRELNVLAKKGQIVFAGSSLMEQFPIYEFLLDQDLPCTIYNRGIGGYTTSELSETLDACVLDLKPSAVFLNIGTNDMNGNDYVLSEFLGRYEQIVRRILQELPDVKLYLLAFYPVNQDAAPDEMTREAFRYRTNERVREANGEIRALAAKYQAEYLDLNKEITDENGNLYRELTLDGIHMHVEGYRRVMKKLVPVLQELASLC